MSKLILAAVLLLLLTPSALAQSTADQIWSEGQEGELKTWRILETNIEDASISHNFQTTWLDFSPYDNAIPQSLILIEISATYTMEESSDGAWNITLESDAFSLPTCYWHLTTVNPGGFLSGDLVTYPNYQVQCAAAVLIEEDTVINFWLNRTILNGSPNTPTDAHITVKGDRGDFIVTNQDTAFERLTNLTASEFGFFFALALLGLYLWGREDFGVRFFGITIVAFDFALVLSFFVASRGQAWPLMLTISTSLLGLGVWMIYAFLRDLALTRRRPS